MLYYTRSAQEVNIKLQLYRNFGKIVTLSSVLLCGIPKPIALEDNRRKAENARLNQRSSSKEKCTKGAEKGVLFMETDSASVCTRGEGGKGTFWHENKLGMVFNSSDIHFWTDCSGKQQHRILKREFVNYLGSASEFRYYFLDVAMKYGVYERKEVVLISDGALWIQSMASELFPTQFILLTCFISKKMWGNMRSLS